MTNSIWCSVAQYDPKKHTHYIYTLVKCLDKPYEFNLQFNVFSLIYMTVYIAISDWSNQSYISTHGSMYETLPLYKLLINFKLFKLATFCTAKLYIYCIFTVIYHIFLCCFLIHVQSCLGAKYFETNELNETWELKTVEIIQNKYEGCQYESL